MTDQQQVWLAATVGAAVGMWLMVPRGDARGRRLGILISVVSLGLFIWKMPRLADIAIECAFYPLATITVISCAASVTSRNPIYTAIWFGVALLSIAGLMLLQGAQFLGMATIVVYAGAILVTFLFVLMLAQPEGQAFYDRLSWRTSLPGLSGAMLASLCGAAVVGMLVVSISDALETPKLALVNSEELEGTSNTEATRTKDLVPNDPKTEDAASTSNAELALQRRAELEEKVLGEQHVARLGAQLFSRHLVAGEVAGTLLLAALVGAIAIVAQGGKNSRRSIRDTLPGDTSDG